ncbi:MAG TPA: DUF1361 domain-containing protein [Steroidobacteraceae bacterium]|jgi:uncharacterized membrane protein
MNGVEADVTRRRRELVLLSALLAWCLALVGARTVHTDTDYFLFLVWNLFLACVPLMMSRLLRAAHQRKAPDIAQLMLAVVWLLFLPNAPYLLTDLVHLQQGSPILYWYDLSMLLSCAGTGLLLGYLSLFDVHKVFEERFGSRSGWTVAIVALLLCGYGIYLGRVMRWNSWDVIANPRGLFGNIADFLFNPTAHIRIYVLSGIISAGLLLGYAILHSMTWVRGRHAKD